jgi:hypothetical protein
LIRSIGGGDLDDLHILTAAFTAANVIFAVTKMAGGEMDRESYTRQEYRHRHGSY